MIDLAEQVRLYMIIRQTFKGGAGSGNFGHAGRPGEVGGSSSNFNSLSNYYSNWVNSLTDDEKDYKGLGGYTNNGYRYVNPKLRGQPLGPRTNSELEHLIIDEYGMIDNLDSALSKAELPDDMIVYRGAVMENPDNLQVGQEFIEKGFMSTSISKDIAMRMGKSMSEQTGNKFVLFRIKAPKGSRAGFIDSLYGRKNEGEMLFARNQFMKILDIRNSGNYKIVTMGIGQ